MESLDLGWMRVFRECAERRGFSAAATALGLTQPAVSYQIRRLEEQLGVAVFERRSRGAELTPAGRRLFEIVARSVDGIDDFVCEVRDRSRRPTIRLRTDYAFSSFWLIPRMSEFRRLHPEIDIQIVATQRFQPDQMERGDIAVIFAEAGRQQPEATMLVTEEVAPVCSRRTFEQLQSAGDGMAGLAQARLINLDTEGVSPWFNWPAYFAAVGVARAPGSGVGDISFNTYSLVLQAALENQGVALGWSGLVDAYLKLEFLVRAGPPIRADDRGYILLPPAARNAGSDAFIDWLKREAAQFQAARGA